MQTPRRPFKIALFLLIALFAPGLSFADDSPGVNDNAPNFYLYHKEGCYWDPKHEPFYFDAIEFAPFANVYPDRRLKDFIDHQAHLSGTWFDFPLLFLLPTRSVGLCDWVPNSLAWTWSGGLDAYASAYAQTSPVRLVAYSLATEFRWYRDPAMFGGFGWRHTSFAGNVLQETVKYLVDNGIEVNGRRLNGLNAEELMRVASTMIRDIIFIRFAHQFTTDNRLKVEYYVVRNLWEAYLSDIFDSLGHDDKRLRPYPFPTAGGFKISYPMMAVMNATVTGAAEYSENKTPYSIGIALDLFSASNRNRGLAIFYNDQRGVGKKAIRTGWYGFQTDGVSYGVRMVVQSF